MRLFKSMVFRRIISKLPESMPSFDRMNIIKEVTREIGEPTVDMTKIPWHLVVMDEIKIDNFITDMSARHGFSYENFLCPPVKNCIKCPGSPGNQIF